MAAVSIHGGGYNLRLGTAARHAHASPTHAAFSISTTVPQVPRLRHLAESRID